jgi:hypothetical protein
MNFSRAQWLAARTRNAARHGLIIAGVGAIVMIATLLTFVLLPRQADRTLAQALAALPPVRDTLALQQRRVRADSLRVQAETQREAARAAVSAALAGVGTPADSLVAASLLPALSGDTLLRDLAAHLARARQAPLAESFRALAVAPALQRHPTLRPVVARLLDSIISIERERDASAAVGGPDARYAEQTARLTALGTRLVALAEPLLQEQAAVPSDSLLDVAVQVATDSVTRLDAQIAEAHRANEARDRRAEALRAQMQVYVPPVAMLFASLVLGVTMGFAVSLWRELRRPTVSDAQELERLTQSRVIGHYGTDRARFSRRTRREQAAVPVISPGAEAWPLLHLTLSHIGDMARDVQVVADRPVVAGAVGLNLAAVAARESRATALVDAAHRAGALVPLLPAAALVRADGTALDGSAPDEATTAAWDMSRALSLGRDTIVSLVLPRRARFDAAARGRRLDDAVAAELLAPSLRAYDFVVYVTDAASASAVPPSADLVLCARLGVTPLAWVMRTVRHAAEQHRRIRAVVLWADEVPLAG